MQEVSPKLTRWQRFRRVPGLLRLSLFSLFCMLGAVVALSGGLLALEMDLPLSASRPEMTEAGNVPLEIPAPPSVFQGRNRLNILVLGIDYNHDSKSIIYTDGARSDTMMVVSLSCEGDVLNVVSIPRDLYVPLSESMGSDRINAAFSYGGVKQARQTVSHLLGIPIHKHLIVKVYGAKKVIDALGGLALDVEKDMDYDDNWGQLHVHLKKGPQLLDGDQTVGYARFRKDNTRVDMEGDVGRMRRQQQVIRALVRSLKDARILGKIPQLAEAVKETLETDLGIKDMVGLAGLYKNFDPKKMRGGQIKGDDGMVGEAMVLIPYEPENTQLVRRLLKDSVDLGLRDVRIRILNSSGELGLGNDMADEMAAQGFNIVKADDSEGKPFKKTQVVIYTKCPRVQQRLRGLFPGAQFRDSATPNNEYDVTITLGSDRGFLARQPKPQPPSASRWGDLPLKPKPAPVARPLPAKPREEPAPLPTPTQLQPDDPLRGQGDFEPPAQG
ncbi:LCP family protein [bacterium]|nr:LCP family protein [bacterium]